MFSLSDLLSDWTYTDYFVSFVVLVILASFAWVSFSILREGRKYSRDNPRQGWKNEFPSIRDSRHWVPDNRSRSAASKSSNGAAAPQSFNELYPNGLTIDILRRPGVNGSNRYSINEKTVFFYHRAFCWKKSNGLRPKIQHVTVAYFFPAYDMMIAAVTICHPNDNYDRKHGNDRAFDRILSKGWDTNPGGNTVQYTYSYLEVPLSRMVEDCTTDVLDNIPDTITGGMVDAVRDSILDALSSKGYSCMSHKFFINYFEAILDLSLNQDYEEYADYWADLHRAADTLFPILDLKPQHGNGLKKQYDDIKRQAALSGVIPTLAPNQYPRSAIYVEGPETAAVSVTTPVMAGPVNSLHAEDLTSKE